jgi:predicted membrane-bound spermidine synthase
MELVWYRMLAPILGGSTYTFGTILAVALLGIGGGGLLYSFTSRRDRQPTLSSFAWTCAIEALVLLIPYVLGDRIAELSLVLRNFGFYGFWGYVAGWVFICTIVVFLAALISGYQFPLLISLLNPRDERFAWKIGLTYCCNTAGCIAGALLGGFGLLPLLTAPGAWKLSAFLLVGMSFFAMSVSLRKRVLPLSPIKIAFILVVALVMALSFADGPTAVWRHAGIGAGRGYLLTGESALDQFRAWKNGVKGNVLHEWDGVESSVALVNIDGLAFFVNGKSDGHSLGDAGTQIMAGLIAAIFRDEPKTSFVVGLGTGSTAGWLAAVPSMKRVDVAEIEPVIQHVAEACGPVNRDAMKNPKIHMMIGDGREIIMSSPRKYDIIFSEPSNPYRAGISSLFTLEFYKSVANRLNPGGIFVHWLQGYEIDAGSIWTDYSTVSEVFPYVESWQTGKTDIALVASMKPFHYDVQKLRQKIAAPPYREALTSAWGEETLEGWLARRIAGTQLAEKIHSLPNRILNTDDHNHLEFDFARSVGRDRNFNIGQIYAEGRLLSDFYAPFANQDINWTEVERKRLKWISFADRDPSIIKAAEERIKSDLDNAVTKGDWAAAKKIISLNGEQLPYNTNRAVLPIVLIETDDSRAEEAIAEHSRYRPQETAALRALYSIKKERWDSAMAFSLEFISNLRQIPWAAELVVSELFSDFPMIAKNTQAGAQKLVEALLEKPFAVYAFDTERYRAAFALAKADAGVNHCTAFEDQKFYYNACNVDYLTYLYNCNKDNRLIQKSIVKELRRMKKDEPPPSFVMIWNALLSKQR